VRRAALQAAAAPEDRAEAIQDSRMIPGTLPAALR